MNNRLIWLILLFVFLPCHLAFGQSIMLGPDGKFDKNVLNLPFAFYNEDFGFAAA